MHYIPHKQRRAMTTGSCNVSRTMCNGQDKVMPLQVRSSLLGVPVTTSQVYGSNECPLLAQIVMSLAELSAVCVDDNCQLLRKDKAVPQYGLWSMVQERHRCTSLQGGSTSRSGDLRIKPQYIGFLLSRQCLGFLHISTLASPMHINLWSLSLQLSPDHGYWQSRHLLLISQYDLTQVQIITTSIQYILTAQFSSHTIYLYLLAAFPLIYCRTQSIDPSATCDPCVFLVINQSKYFTYMHPPLAGVIVHAKLSQLTYADVHKHYIFGHVLTLALYSLNLHQWPK